MAAMDDHTTPNPAQAGVPQTKERATGSRGPWEHGEVGVLSAQQNESMEKWLRSKAIKLKV